MSFSIDLWNGVDIIREKYTTIRREFRSFVNFLIKYNTIEIQHCKNLDILYNEFKEKNNKTESIFESARISAINMIDIESQTRKIFIENTSNLIKNINLFLQDLKYPSNEIPDLSVNFNKDLDKLRMKQEIFYSQCKEMCSLISQLDLENKLNEKSNETKLEKILNKLLKSRDEYLLSINETNVKRRNFNKKVEKIMNKYEKEHKKLLKNFIENLTEFNNDKRKLIDVLSQKENYFFSEYFQKLKVEDEIFNFIVNNATKEFPMIQIEFTPFKKKDFEIFLNLKYQNKLKQNDLNKILTTIQNYFQKNNIFPLNFLQTGILKNVPKPQKENFFNTRKFSLFLKKSFTIENSNNNNTKNNENDSSLEKEINIIKNYEFIKNTINELMTNNEVKLFENSYVIDADVSKILNEPKKFDDINDKIGEFRDLLLNQKDEANLVYIEAFIKTLSYLRSKGRYSINDETYIIFSLLFFLLLKQNKNNDYILKNLLMLSQTFYKIEGGDKIYISESLKNKDLFKSKEIWHRCINYSLKLANKDFIANKNEYINKINKDAYSTVITYLCDLKFFTNDETVYNEVYEFYKKIYNLKEEDINTIVENSIKSRMKKKDKENETQKEENETKKEEKGIKTEENEIKKEEDETKKEENEIIKEEKEEKEEKNIIKKGEKEEKEDKIEIKNEENEIKREEKEDKDEIKKEKKEEKDEIKNEEKDDKNGIKTKENEIKSEENEIKKEEKEDKNEIKKEENEIKKDENEIKIEEIEAKEEKEDKNDMKKEENKIENEEKEAKNEKKQNILNNIDNNIDFNIDNNTDNNENKKEIIETKDAVNNENNNNDKDIENINNIDSES